MYIYVILLKHDYLGEDTFGTFVYHCHIMQHSDIGMMSIITVLPRPNEGLTFAPSALPSIIPAISSPPTSNPTFGPSIRPSVSPTELPSFSPSIMPTFNPSTVPSAAPTLHPSSNPSATPTFNPSATPSNAPVFSGRTFYVSNQRPEASDLNDGNLSSPWRSIRKVCSVA